ncbi:hypothetical protein LPTSP2_38960 [Leptospira ellinghausenii]|uniref:DUF6602 domain-containing protein n=1 Tax=Leptospira ellinghausenii TaxID=1917822 RepID=A0A2P2DIV3_9LEPT|nr:DUF6602 domain-containing protein [Leptospira ellinghausenii]GBF44593.1 hypothetical protein LPTSP2_38960 [Leptospira ellinghausenii]
MKKPFYRRLEEYFENVAKVLRGEAEVASIFPNTTDIGFSREYVYARFLKMHAPSKCNIYFGGYLFGEDGEESKQLDIIISTDTAPKYNFYNSEGNGKSFGPVEGCLGIASIKSNLDKEQLFDALDGISSIPKTLPLTNRINPLVRISDYDDWPYKIIYASSGLSGQTIFNHLNEYYNLNKNIPINRRPDIIHVAGKYVIFRIKKGFNVTNPDGSNFPLEEGKFHIFETKPDIQAMLWTIEELQNKASASTHILFKYNSIIENIFNK